MTHGLITTTLVGTLAYRAACPDHLAVTIELSTGPCCFQGQSLRSWFLTAGEGLMPPVFPISHIQARLHMVAHANNLRQAWRAPRERAHLDIIHDMGPILCGGRMGDTFINWLLSQKTLKLHLCKCRTRVHFISWSCH